MAKQVMPEAQLEARANDIKVTDELLLQISLFSQLKRKPSLDKFPGSLVLRRYRAGEVICRQADAGWTAFYILTTEDAHNLFQQLARAAPEGRDKHHWESLLRTQAARLEQIRAQPESGELRQAATAHLTVARRSRRSAGGWLRSWFGGDSHADSAPAFIPIDGPTAINSRTMQAPLHEGEIFGQQSCRFGTPRSTTIIAARDCVLLEMLRNIFDQLQKDLAYRARTDEAYRRHVLDFEVRKLSIFNDLTDAQFALIRDQLELVTCEPNQVIFDEYERSDSVYLIRGGMVKVLKKASALLAAEQVRDWPAFITALRQGEAEAAKPRQRVWKLLSDKARLVCQAGPVSEDAQRIILQALNDIIKGRGLEQAVEFAKLAASEEMPARLGGFPASQKAWSDQDHRRYGRLLLDAAFEGMIRVHRRRVGPDCVLFYCSAGDFLGEGSVLGERIRGETCIAHGQSKDSKEAGPIELVRIPATVLASLLEVCPAIQAKIEQKAGERRRQAQEQVRVPIWDEKREVLLSEQFQQLGLIQGQQLMLIDLDRCTRCDECVRACVASHDDGRSRLFLDGPRFGKYLVPISCRSCLEPVCMTGCPVGSIHRGHNGQMVIEDWCIGCGLCAQQCPYGSIQMHDIGIIAENAHGWRYLAAAAVGKANWKSPRYRARRWIEGAGPFVNDRVFRETLAGHLPALEMTADTSSRAALGDFDLLELAKQGPASNPARLGQAICFRYEFRLSREQAGADRQYRLTVTTGDPNAQVWINGQAIPLSGEASGGKREVWLPPRDVPHIGRTTQKVARVEPAPGPQVAPPLDVFRSGRNVLAVQVSPDFNIGDAFFQARLDEVRKPSVAPQFAEEVNQKQVTERAVVCDLCSSASSGHPACVQACPHDAAMRIDARTDFPGA